jgi:hypothetical protein
VIARIPEMAAAKAKGVGLRGMRSAISPTRLLLALAFALALSACDGGEKTKRATELRPEDRPGPMVVQEREAPPQPAATAERNAAVAAAAAAAQAEAVATAATNRLLGDCAQGLASLQKKVNAFRGPAAQRNTLRASVDSAVVAYLASEPENCLRSVNGGLAASGASFSPRPENVSCANGLVGAILQVPQLNRDFQRQ